MTRSSRRLSRLGSRRSSESKLRARVTLVSSTRDEEIYEAARKAEAVVLTKDVDFVALLQRIGPPPAVLWVRCGNTSNAHIRRVLRRTLPKALELIAAGEDLVEIAEVEE